MFESKALPGQFFWGNKTEGWRLVGVEEDMVSIGS
jgi:hypothetical protein